MGQNDTIQIGPYKYTIVKREGRRVLVSWVESTGVEREMWFIVPQNQKSNLTKAA